MPETNSASAAPDLQPRRPGLVQLLVHFLHMIRFSHTLFALPFALSALLVIAVRYRAEISISWQNGALIVIAFTAMRSFAMAVNRYADRHIDALNPRTATREIPAGKLSPKTVLLFGFASLTVLVISAWLLAPIAGFLSLPAALIVAGYSAAKRFTWLCHFWLGLAIGMAPIAVYIALLQKIQNEAWLMSLALSFYIAGFDILYALQDIDFDRKHGLYSIPARFGAAGALWISRISHLVALCSVALLFSGMKMPDYIWAGFALLALLLFAEHWLVGSAKNLRYEKIPVAFFNVNSIFSISFLLVIAAGLFL